jgi:hypothetical protein
MSDPQWTPAVGERVRVVRDLEVRYRGATFTVRDVRSSVRIDDGAHEDPDYSTNGARVSAWVSASALRPWDGAIKETIGVRLARDLRAARADVVRYRDETDRVIALARRRETALGAEIAALIAEIDRLRARVAELEAEIAAPRRGWTPTASCHISRGAQ